MSYYDNSQWSAPPAARQPSWEQPPPPSRSGTSSTGAREEPNAFIYQLAEVERAIDNLVKSGKMPFGFFENRAGSGPSTPGSLQRHGSMGEFDGMRPQSGSGLQSYYQNQRFGPRPTEHDQMQQAKRRMAAQREKELRNYHQEQQYAKNLTGPKSDRSMSPNTGMSEEERRELIARQHRALYGNESSLYTPSDKNSRPGSQDARSMGARGNSPLAYEPFGMQGQSGGGESAVQMPPRDHSKQDPNSGATRSRANSNSSPSSNQNATFSMFENAQHSSRTSNSSPTGGSPPGNGNKAGSGVAPIGTRPAANQAPIQNLQKRSTTPLPSPLSYTYSANDQSNNERATSAASNPSTNHQDKSLGHSTTWGNSSAAWGNQKSSLGVQSAVWG